MDINSKRSELISALMAMPQRELVDVLNNVLARRVADTVGPDYEEVKLVVAEAYRGRNSDAAHQEWELLVLASPEETDTFATDSAPTEEGSCCGVTLIGYAKRVMCPICGQRANLT